MAHKTMIDGTAYEISGGKALVDGTAYNIKDGKTLVDGTGYEIGWGAPIGDLAVGSSVYMKVGGVSTEFLVIHQGNPDSSIYDSSCKGTWLLMKEINGGYVAPDNDGISTSNSDNRYTYTDFPSLCSSFISTLDTNIQKIVKTVKIPYYTGSSRTSSSRTLKTGVDGYSCKAFALSIAEVGYTGTELSYKAGASLDYFAECTGRSNDKRIAYNSEGVEVGWWLRDPSSSTYNYMGYIGVNPYNEEDKGYIRTGCTYYAYGALRPAFILPPETMVSSGKVKA